MLALRISRVDWSARLALQNPSAFRSSRLALRNPRVDWSSRLALRKNKYKQGKPCTPTASARQALHSRSIGKASLALPQHRQGKPCTPGASARQALHSRSDGKASLALPQRRQGKPCTPSVHVALMERSGIRVSGPRPPQITSPSGFVRATA